MPTGGYSMQVDLTSEEMYALLEAIEYTVERVQNSAGISYELRQRKLAMLETVQDKLRHALGNPAET
jgi:hypothetical protein